MDWLINLFTTTDSIAHIALLYAIVISVGVLLGKVKVGGISLGVTFVLFAGILAGHIGFTAPINILGFIQDIGLILFVFCIGLQVGPGFFESFRKGGVTLNLLTTAIILLNIAVMFICYWVFFDTSNVNNLPMMVGTLYGAVTNTPGLGAANEALTSIFTPGSMPQIASGYACAYPLGVLGIIGATIAIRYITRVKLEKEEQNLAEQEDENPHAKPHQMHLKVSNAYIAGRTLLEISQFLNRDVICSRLLHDGEVTIPNRNTIFSLGDEVLIVCTEADAEAIKAFIGPEIDTPWHTAAEIQPLISRRIVVTNPAMNGKTSLREHSTRYPGHAGSLETRYRWRPTDYRHIHRPIWLSFQTCYLYHNLGQHDATRNRTRALPCIGGHQGRCRLLGNRCTGRRTEICLYRLPHHHRSHSDCGNDCPPTLQVQLLHHHGYDCRFIYRPPGIGLRQQCLLARSTVRGLLHRLPFEHVPAHLYGPAHRAVLLWGMKHFLS